jgi:hypothetical protein
VQALSVRHWRYYCTSLEDKAAKVIYTPVEFSLTSFFGTSKVVSLEAGSWERFLVTRMASKLYRLLNSYDRAQGEGLRFSKKFPR